MTPGEAEAYHGEQIATFAATATDMVGAYTLPYAAEAIGIVRAALACEVPVSISFTVETDGRLPSGQPLGEAIEAAELDSGDPEEMGRLYGELRPHWPSARVLGGCYGTDTRHIAAICENWLGAD